MGWQAGEQDEGNGRVPRPRRPFRRGPRPAGFSRGADWDGFPPSSDLAFALETASGEDWACPDASHDDLVGLLRQWQALESWAAAGKLGVLRALIREDQLFPAGGSPSGLPGPWSDGLSREVALALAMPAGSADRLMWTAWDLDWRLPGIGQRLAAGKLTLAKARAVLEAFSQLSNEDVIIAEELVLDRLDQEPEMTYGQLQRVAAAVALLVDPDSATRRRQGAEKDNARVTMFREDSGAAGLSGRDLPTDQALTANNRVNGRAEEYKASGAFPGTRMEQLRAIAYLDMLNDITAAQRIAFTKAAADAPAGDHGPGPDDPGPDDPGPDDAGRDDPGPDGPDGHGPDGSGPAQGGGPGCGGCGPGCGGPGDGGGPAADGRPGTGGAFACPCRECDGSCTPPQDGQDDPGPGYGDPGDEVPPAGDGTGPAGPASEHRPDAPAVPDGPALPPRLTDLVIPLPTLLGWDQRPGESHGLGPLDPELCRTLAALAAASPHTQLCITVTTDDGIAIGHGCTRRHPPGSKPGSPRGTDGPGATGPPGTLPARLNITVTAGLLAALPATPATPATPPGPGWSLTYDGQGPPGGHGTWTLTLPDGRKLTVALEPMPTFTCDHRHESRAYQPNDTLRHLVQVRDRTCTLPVCNRHARECDFEHATPYDQGGRTCACNAGARSRACHRVKQAKGWKVTQPRPGWHQWETPSGRIYIQGPYRYPT
jgi:hypothetical protein